MKSRILAIGKPSLPWAAAGVEDYSRRLRRYGGVELEWLKARDGAEAAKKQLSGSEGWLRVVLDERGEALSTVAWAKRWQDWQMRGKKGVAFLIGGADGHEEPLRAQADQILSLAPMTLQHELALVVLLEQIYRVQSLLAGAPYHREG